jgi:hypothetical protein
MTKFADHGLRVVMPSACKCRSRAAIIESAHLLTCATCRRQRGWLSKQETDFINTIINTFGRPTASIVLRNLPASGAARCQYGSQTSSAPQGHRNGR